MSDFNFYISTIINNATIVKRRKNLRYVTLHEIKKIRYILERINFY